MSKDVQPYGWVISYTYMGEAKQAFHRHNAIGDYRDLDPSATSVAVFSGQAPVWHIEPVAWTDPKNIEFLEKYKSGGVVIFFDQERAGQVPIYAHPAPVRQPLTDEKVEDMRADANRGYNIEKEDYFKAVRDAEEAHGIKP